MWPAMVLLGILLFLPVGEGQSHWEKIANKIRPKELLYVSGVLTCGNLTLPLTVVRLIDEDIGGHDRMGYSDFLEGEGRFEIHGSARDWMSAVDPALQIYTECKTAETAEESDCSRSFVVPLEDLNRTEYWTKFRGFGGTKIKLNDPIELNQPFPNEKEVCENIRHIDSDPL